ncbi:hypothetical protein RHMOL_Rhmol07G0226800 [Rhododendron molle]|uniref:Uncharacterized protein n=1 Tax=Rhododendron molle TaxID=49168 RepID=A0ACC0N5P4_RHOML|nr:hypothetical protein RHMOL_Rhmol07G0226800 [Rhododendron molle]
MKFPICQGVLCYRCLLYASEMNLTLHSGALSSSRVRHEFPANRTLLVSAKIKEPEAVLRRRLALRKVDRELSRGNYKTALTLVKQLQGKPGGLRGFGAAKQVSASELESLTHESVIEDHLMCTQHEAGHFLVGYLLGALPKRYVVSKMEALMQNEFVGGGVEFMGFEFLREVNTGGILQMNLSRQKPHDAVRLLFPVHVQLSMKSKFTFAAALNVTKESVFRSLKAKFHQRVVTCMDLSPYDILPSGAWWRQTLNRFSCVILGGLVAEHLVFGYSQGLHGDVEKVAFLVIIFEEDPLESQKGLDSPVQLNRVLRWMGFEESEIDSHLKWAVMNTLLILVHHQEARSRLAETMALGKSVGSCIDVIENYLNDIEL